MKPYHKDKEVRDEKIRRMYFVEGYSMNQLVKKLGYSKNTIFNAIHSKKKGRKFGS